MAHGVFHLIIGHGHDSAQPMGERLQGGGHRGAAGHAVGDARGDWRGDGTAGSDRQRVGRGVRRDDTDDLALMAEGCLGGEHAAGTGAKSDGDVDGPDARCGAQQFHGIGADARHEQRVIAGQTVPAAFGGDGVGEFDAVLEVVTPFDEFDTEGAHGSVLLDAVAARHHDAGGDTGALCRVSDGLAVIAAGGGDDAADRGLRALQPVEIDEPTADLECTDRRVVLVLHPASRPQPRLEQRPAVLWRRREAAGDQLRCGLQLRQRGEGVHAVCSVEDR
jgi:hypothetical protein